MVPGLLPFQCQEYWHGNPISKSCRKTEVFPTIDVIQKGGVFISPLFGSREKKI
jgi:hypothetical protein